MHKCVRIGLCVRTCVHIKLCTHRHIQAYAYAHTRHTYAHTSLATLVHPPHSSELALLEANCLTLVQLLFLELIRKTHQFSLAVPQTVHIGLCVRTCVVCAYVCTQGLCVRTCVRKACVCVRVYAMLMCAYVCTQSLCVCTCVRIGFVCAYVCTQGLCVRTCVRIGLCVRTCVRIGLCVRTCVRMGLCVCTCVPVAALSTIHDPSMTTIS